MSNKLRPGLGFRSQEDCGPAGKTTETEQSLPGYESEPEFYFASGDTNVFTGPISRSANDMSLLCTFSKGDRNA